MAKLPSFQFYPGDWMKDPALRSVSYAARGLWMDMLSLMFENDRRGYLQVNGKIVTAEQLARMTGGSTDDVSRYLQELENSGVYSRSDDGTIFSRRQVRDERARQKGALRVQKFRERNADVTVDVTPVTEDEDEIAVGVAVDVTSKPKEVLISFELSGLEELIYESYPRKVGRAKALDSIRRAMRKVSKQLNLEENEAAEYLHKAVIEYAGSPAGQRGEFTPHPATWFNQERWNDARVEWYRSQEASSGQPAANKAQQRQNSNLAAYAESRERRLHRAANGDLGGGNAREPHQPDARTLLPSAERHSPAPAANGVHPSGSRVEVLPQAGRAKGVGE